MSSSALSRLKEERKDWRLNPLFGFVAKPKRNRDGSINYMKWCCAIPGRTDSPWAGGLYHLVLTFSEDYPTSPPNCRFTSELFHPNISITGGVYLPILDILRDWKPDLSIKIILHKLQNLIHAPNIFNPLNTTADTMWRLNRKGYIQQIKLQAAVMKRRD